VKLSVKSDYAVRAVHALARQYQTGQAQTAEALATEFGIPPNYLVQIFVELKSNQIVKSVRGKTGGYLLARPPAAVTLGEVLRAIHGEVFDSPALGDGQCPPELRNAWKKLQRALDETADSITFQQLLEESTEKEKMYYI
jgi:Rrf2 family protein